MKLLFGEFNFLDDFNWCRWNKNILENTWMRKYNFIRIPLWDVLQCIVCSTQQQSYSTNHCVYCCSNCVVFCVCVCAANKIFQSFWSYIDHFSLTIRLKFFEWAQYFPPKRECSKTNILSNLVHILRFLYIFPSNFLIVIRPTLVSLKQLYCLPLLTLEANKPYRNEDIFFSLMLVVCWFFLGCIAQTGYLGRNSDGAG